MPCTGFLPPRTFKDEPCRRPWRPQPNGKSTSFWGDRGRYTSQDSFASARSLSPDVLVGCCNPLPMPQNTVRYRSRPDASRGATRARLLPEPSLPGRSVGNNPRLGQASPALHPPTDSLQVAHRRRKHARFLRPHEPSQRCARPTNQGLPRRSRGSAKPTDARASDTRQAPVRKSAVAAGSSGRRRISHVLRARIETNARSAQLLRASIAKRSLRCPSASRRDSRRPEIVPAQVAG